MSYTRGSYRDISGKEVLCLIVGLGIVSVSLIFGFSLIGLRFDSGPFNYGTVESKTFDPGMAWVDPQPKVKKNCDNGMCEFTYTTEYFFHERARSWSVQTNRSVGDSRHYYNLIVPTEIWNGVSKGSDYVETGSETKDEPQELKRVATDEEIKRYFAGELRVADIEPTLATSN